MILADENIDHSIIESIRQASIDVYSIYEQQRGIDDAAIIEFSRTPPRIILTEDKDFGEWVFAHHIKGISVLLIRYHYRETENIKLILLKLLTQNITHLTGNFTTLTTQKIRTKPIN